MKCTNPRIGQLIARYELGALEASERDAFVAHLLQCDCCYSEVYSMAPFMGVIREHREAVQRGEITSDWTSVQAAIAAAALPPFWLRKPVLAAASVLIVLGATLLALYLTRQPPASTVVKQPGAVAPGSEVAGGPPPAWRDLEIPKAVYTPSSEQAVWRSAGSATAFEQAVAAYQQNNFAAAAEQLEVVTRLEPQDAEAYFYRGVSLLLLGRQAEAVAPLQRAVELRAGTQRERSRYYLALAYLKTDQPRQALSELDAVMEMQGQYRAAAERLKQQIMETLK